ncbi:hypothetical protein LTR56_014881 [Elasticomyces elasticus]|nr:hypothetical protein LTR22_021184 [Elasticomyces elasticus]KAK3635109.1 hypothetical protein LTR56_014881 [Elasticomyces elasticus]KAK5749894.1 hypothetical protein LTS12_020040 [Elasticomyces elasticus]
MAPRINLPPITRILLLVNAALSILNATIRLNKWRYELGSLTPVELASKSNYLSNPQWAVPYLALVPTKSIWYPWTFVTAAWVENNILSLAISGTVVWFGGRYLERAFGSTEFARFVCFVTFIPNALAFCIYALWHAATGTPEYPTPLQGLLALEAAFLVALKQLVPEHTVSLFRGALRVRIKHFPALFTLANMISGPLLGTDTALWLSLLGFMTGWIYLRFFRVTEITGAATGGSGAVMKGDASDTFAFVAFFPDVMHPFLSPICDAIYGTLVALRVCTPFSDDAVETGNENAASSSEGLPTTSVGGGGRQAEAERRRAIALKALDQRLNAAAASRAVVSDTTTVPGEAPASTGESLPEVAAEIHQGGPV